MVFSSVVFLCFFLPAVLALYCACPAKWRNGLLFLVSLVFYAWGEPVYILIMLFSTVFDYGNGRLLEYLTQKRDAYRVQFFGGDFQTKDAISEMTGISEDREKYYQRCRNIVLLISVVGNLGILGFFKYSNLFLETAASLSGQAMPTLKLALPIGISFYTFQTMSYTIDVYREKVKAQHNIIAFGMYVSMFPQLIAGPIVRYATVADQLADRRLISENMAHGMQRFLFGLGKKVLLANQIGALWSEISAQDHLSMLGAWLGAVAYAFQIYFDFSGYSDMAIGLGQIFGFTFPENFNYPYQSKNITEFWRRWHMTLSEWFREYVYIPLGGNRRGRKRQVFNLFVVWSLTGFWHGASWNYLLWGIYFFVLLTVEKFFLLPKLEKAPKWIRHLYAMFFIVLGWAIFANEDFGTLQHYLVAMFGGSGSVWDQTVVYQLYTHLPLLLIMAVGCTKAPKVCCAKLGDLLLNKAGVHQEQTRVKVKFIAVSVYSFIVLLFSFAFLISGSYNPFLYFRF